MPYDPAARFDVEMSDVEYLRHADEGLLARVYQPKGDGLFPAVVDVHGGAWSGGDRTNDEPEDDRIFHPAEPAPAMT